MNVTAGRKYIKQYCPSNARSLYLLLLSFLSGVLFTFIFIENPSNLFSITKGSIVYESLPIGNHLKTIRPRSFDRCGTWQESYINLHRSILNGSLPPRYLVSVAVEAGLADRLTGTLTEFYLALFTNRAFQIITYGTLPRFEAAFLAPNINWSRSGDDDKLVSNVKVTYRGQRSYTGDRSYPSHVNTSLYWPVYLVNDEGGNSFFLSSNISKYPTNHDHTQTLYAGSNRGRIVRLFDNPYHRSQLFRMGLRPETAVRCAFDFLFSPTDQLKKAMSREFSILKSDEILKISINIRVGDAVFDPEADSHTTLVPYEAYFDCASKIENICTYTKSKCDLVFYFRFITTSSISQRKIWRKNFNRR